MADTILQGEKITKVFQQGKAETKVLDRIDIKIFEKDFTVIMGPSGAGKSTLLYSLSGMDQISGAACSTGIRRSAVFQKNGWPDFGRRNLDLYSSRPIWSVT